jgi:hypothetical protein
MQRQNSPKIQATPFVQRKLTLHLRLCTLLIGVGHALVTSTAQPSNREKQDKIVILELGKLTIGGLSEEKRNALKAAQNHMSNARRYLLKGELNDATSEENWAYTVAYSAGLANLGQFEAGSINELSPEEWELGSKIAMGSM